MAPRKLWLVLLLVTAGCYADRTVGVSDGRMPREVPVVKPKFPSVIVGQNGEYLELGSPRVGDMDGDGFDDFVLSASGVEIDGAIRPVLYLFYGREEFPAQLSTADADAVFEIDSGYNGAAGDLNGDGYADLLLTHFTSADFFFGGKQRASGHIARGAAGVTWSLGALPPPFSPELLIRFMVSSAGDLDGDGCSDLIVRANALFDVLTGEQIDRAWVAMGHRGEWQSVEWDSSSAIADFGYGPPPVPLEEPSAMTLLNAEPAGDLDGDRRGDLVVASGPGSLLFYGKRDYPSQLSAAGADANLRPSAALEDAFRRMPTEQQNEQGFAFGAPVLFGQRFGDLDGDGNDDLALMGSASQGGWQVAYGRRWSGETELEPELEITQEDPLQQYIISAEAGELDGDGFPDMLVSVVAGLGENTAVPTGIVYMVRGTGERLRGTIQLTESDRWSIPVAVRDWAGPEANSVLNLMMIGDINGDGSQEILTNVTPTEPTGGMPVYLVPGAPRAPD